MSMALCYNSLNKLNIHVRKPGAQSLRWRLEGSSGTETSLKIKSAGPARWDHEGSPRQAQVGAEKRGRKRAEVRVKVEVLVAG